ncbi:SEC-C metal-binding domain-containing protein [Vibrio cholerae]|uniref:SEC-C metal-binding domain-containing protein n=1 Tax=Vibrio cholerae TaxID=666 RepID=UPI0004E2BC4D|nr:SEC-C metal-binding domain-containing protein [Vibrio cholerae]KFE17458.1 SEC-C motif family protein [Vibrio cholerae]GIC20767.1 hypothetical protein VCSRO53_1027 [Vibrio cholerae]
MQLVNPKIMDRTIVADDITDEDKAELVHNMLKKRNRNNPCICLSGKKLKHCCLGKVKALQQQIKEAL